MYHKRGLWAIKAKNNGVFPHHEKKAVEPLPKQKSPKFYPADDVKVRRTVTRTMKPTKLRPSITPGTVLILLAGSCFPQATSFWVASCHWAFQAQWCSIETCKPTICDWYIHKG